MAATNSQHSNAENAGRLVREFATRADRGDETWIEDAIEAFLGLTVTGPQREICRSVASNKRTAVSTANGLGKTYIVAAIANIWQTVKYPAVTFGTSGTGKKLYRTLCRPIEKLHDSALEGAGLPGEFKQQPPRIDYADPEHFFEASSPSETGELEGVHTAYTLAIIEETDKKDVTADTIDAMRSLVSDDQDRMIAVGNPPEDEADIFHRLLSEGSSWNAIQYSSFEGHNVQLEQDHITGEKVDGIASISAIRDDWKDYHDQPWPGVEQAARWSLPYLDSENRPVAGRQNAAFRSDGDPVRNGEFRTDLSTRWYRRRGGIIPPGDAQVNRPFYTDTIQRAFNATDSTQLPQTAPSGSGVDVARSVDNTVLATRHGDFLRIEYAKQGTDHPTQESRLRSILDPWPDHPIAVDAIGQGAHIADNFTNAYSSVTHFGNNEKPIDEMNYKNKWAEALALLGEFFESGGTVVRDPDRHYRKLKDELSVAARVVAFEENELTRGTVLEATSKTKIKERLDHSPDFLDAAAMAVWASEAGSVSVNTDDNSSAEVPIW